MKALKDWTGAIEGLSSMEGPDVLNLYSEMLATAHDIGHTVPDDQLIETEDADALRKVIPALHDGIKTAHAAAKAGDAEKKSARAKANGAAPAPIKKKKTTAAKVDAATKSEPAPKKPAKAAAQKEPKSKDDTAMATAAKKTAKKAPAKKAAKAAPAKKTAKKAAKANARTPVASGAGRNPFGENAVIKVLNKDTGIKADSERGRRVAVAFKYNGKKVADYYAKEQAPFNRTDTLRFLVDKGFISVK